MFINDFFYKFYFWQTNIIWELKFILVIKFCIFTLSASLARWTKVFQNLSLIRFFSFSKISISSLPGVEMLRILNLFFFKNITMDFGLKKFIWCGGIIAFELSHKASMSAPELDNAVNMNRSFLLFNLAKFFINFDGLCKCSINSKQVNTFLFVGKSSFLTFSKNFWTTVNF